MSNVQLLSIILLNTVYYGNIFYLLRVDKDKLNEIAQKILFVVMMTILLINNNLGLFLSILVVKVMYELIKAFFTYEVEGFVDPKLQSLMIENITCFVSFIIFMSGM